MVNCILCLSEQAPDYIQIFSNKGVSLDVCGIVSKHFWIKPKKTFTTEQEQVCVTCWAELEQFHRFYKRVAEAHNWCESKSEFLPAGLENDPLPQEVIFKSEDLASAGQLVEALGDSFFDSEVKVEVHDLELLPQIEIIEEVAQVSDRAQRASRRNRLLMENSSDNSNLSPIPKRIKKENCVTLNEFNDIIDVEPKVETANDLNIKTDTVSELSTSIDNEAKPDKKVTNLEETPKKRRGRPKKLKEETPKRSPKQRNNVSIENAAIKIELPASESDGDDTTYANLTSNFDSGTDDTSSSSSDNVSEKSLPDIEPQERYAEIPKRIVVKPKKYRKREKPLVPPKRMTREEIERKNQQQAEYDKIIAQFFMKYSCPKCNLLVQNFGDMKKHFRASHNDEPGYMTCCGRKFQLRKTLAEHIYVHWNPEHFKCSVCSKIFQDSRSLEIHELAHTNPTEQKERKLFHCDKCPKAFTTKAAFEYHSFSKHVPKSEFKFSCPECNKKLPTERKLKDHIKYMHDPESAIICDKCGKQMRSQSNLKKHHEIEHSDVPRPAPVPMQCEICGTWLRHIAGLKQHMKTIHEDSGGEHRCHICNKVSTNARALKRHIYHNHECERKFKCTMCEKAFKRPQDLREHTSTHTGEVLYTCPNCPMTFFSNANMYKHRQRLHRAEWEADKKKPVPPNIMQQAVGATAAMKMQQASLILHPNFMQTVHND